MNSLKSIVVFCGSSDGYNDIYRETAYMLGKLLAQKKIRLIYGGSRLGVMGALAAGALDNHGEVIGIIPTFLKRKEVVHEGLTQLITVNTMHERKMKMHELSDAIIALPGGWGTMEELFEMMTWAQLGLHPKPIGILNVENYYDPLLALLTVMTQEGFLKEIYREMVIVREDMEELIYQLENYEVPNIPKWMTSEGI